MKNSIKILCTLAVGVALAAYMNASPASDSPQKDYADKWAATAVREMYRSGVPASITLAQGILESRSGLSPLAADGNNHFGIKCHTDWKGKTMKMDDDAKGECFRVYSDADESFKDHSDFLRYRDRYKFLFDFETTDYESWAYGLKKAGYATDPSYAAKLIKLIEDYDLAKFDSMTVAEAEKYAPVATKPSTKPSSEPEVKPAEKNEKVAENQPAKEKKMSKRAARKAERDAAKAEKDIAAAGKKEAPAEEKLSGLMAHRKNKAAKAKDEDMAAVLDEIPESPLAIERAVQLTKNASEQFSFSLTREVFMMNGVPFVYAIEGETYDSIASYFKLFPKEILKFNDLSAPERLLAGSVVYLQQKKSQAQVGLDKYIVEEDGEKLRDICQRFAVKVSAVEKMNGWSAGHVLRAGDTVILRK